MAKLGLVSIVAMALAGAAEGATVEPRYSAVASEIAGREATVRCNTTEEWQALTESQGRPFSTEGFARIAEGVAELAPSVCSSLAETVAAAPAARCLIRHRTVTRKVRKVVRVKVDGVWRTRRVIVKRRVRVPVYGACPQLVSSTRAVWTLAHEATHLTGVVDEAETDCYAIQRVSTVARGLGLDGRYARRMGEHAWWIYGLASPYRSPECRPGGPWDLDPATAAWP